MLQTHSERRQRAHGVTEEGPQIARIHIEFGQDYRMLFVETHLNWKLKMRVYMCVYIRKWEWERERESVRATKSFSTPIKSLCVIMEMNTTYRSQYGSLIFWWSTPQSKTNSICAKTSRPTEPLLSARKPKLLHSRVTIKCCSNSIHVQRYLCHTV